MSLELREFQAEGVRFLQQQGRALLADDLGLGKSAQLIRASEGETLVVAPAMVLDGGTWTDEIAKWADDPARFTTVSYTSLTQLKETRGKQRVYRIRDGFDRPGGWDTIIFDEAHYAKGRGTIRTEASQALAARAKRVYLATGTPIPNFAQELFTLLQMLDPEEAMPGGRLGSYWRWAGRWFEITPTRYSQYNVGSLLGCNRECERRLVTDPCQHYHEFVEANLGDQFLQRKRADVLPELPPLTEVRIETPMGPLQRREYRRMKKEMIAETESGEAVVSWSASAKHVRLDQIATGLSLLGEDETKWGVNDGKLARLRMDLESRSAPTLVMGHYHRTVEACLEVARSLGLRAALVYGPTPAAERLRLVRAFQAGQLDVLVGSLETLAEGLTLTEADLIIFVEKSWKPSRNEQALRRIHRIGQRSATTAYDYVTPDTLDEGKRDLLQTKTDHQMRVLRAAQLARIA